MDTGLTYGIILSMQIYGYTLPQVPERQGWIKVGQAQDSDKRIKEQIGATWLDYEKVFDQSALAGKRNVSDHDVHRLLVERGFERLEREWFRCNPDDVQSALDFLKQKYINEDKRQELGDKFYEELRNWYFWATEEKFQGTFQREHDTDHALRMIVRLLLICFLQEKELVPRELFDEDWINANLKENEEHSYYQAILYNLFFYSLNTPQENRGELENRKLMTHYNKVKDQLHKRIPFLNGGLFNKHPGDDFALSNQYFFSGLRTVTLKELGGRYGVKGLVTILKSYKYTLDETDDTEYIDPEFIGKTFECLLACIDADNKQSRRKVTGSYYTPREIVDYMVNEALDMYANQSRNRKIANVDSQSYDSGSEFDENLLLRCAILDPACGSGAFPCGVMNSIMKRIDPNKTLSQSKRYDKKLEILRNVIYGVDIQPMAVQITVLRLFLSMLQEIKPNPKAENFGISPLPNLDYKFVVANSLIGINVQDLFFQEYRTKFAQLMDLKK
ncbi:MAG: N-6 DNA methylase, partial [Planctomycetaceae bacterium]|nr:N-6 DNA methylase [Planctomycetaceae bacterium]